MTRSLCCFKGRPALSPRHFSSLCFLKQICLFIVYACAPECMQLPRDQKRMLGLRELELPVAVSCHVSAGSEPRSSERTARALKELAIFQPPPPLSHSVSLSSPSRRCWGLNPGTHTSVHHRAASAASFTTLFVCF